MFNLRLYVADSVTDIQGRDKKYLLLRMTRVCNESKTISSNEVIVFLSKSTTEQY